MTVRQEKQFCANCGTLLKENAKFCPMCGNVVNSFKKTSDSVEEAAVSVKSTKEPKKNRRKKVIIISSIIIVGIIFLLGIIGGLYGEESAVVDIGEAALGRDFMQRFISEHDYLEVSADMYESPDKQVNVYLDEKGIPEKIHIGGGKTKIYGIGIGDIFTLEKTGKVLTSRGYEYSGEDEMSITYSAEIVSGKEKSIQLFVDNDLKIYNIIYFVSISSIDMEEMTESYTVDEETENPMDATQNSAETEEAIKSELSQGTYILNDGESIYSTAEITEDATGLRIDIDAVGYGGHQQGFASGYLNAMKNNTYSCFDENDNGTFILELTDDGFNITAHSVAGAEDMFSSIEGNYVFGGWGNAKGDDYYEEDLSSSYNSLVGTYVSYNEITGRTTTIEIPSEGPLNYEETGGDYYFNNKFEYGIVDNEIQIYDPGMAIYYNILNIEPDGNLSYVDLAEEGSFTVWFMKQ